MLSCYNNELKGNVPSVMRVPTNIPPSSESEGSLMALLVNVSTSPGSSGAKTYAWYFVKRVSGVTVFPHSLDPSSFLRTYICSRNVKKKEKENKNQRAMILAREKGRRRQINMLQLGIRTNERLIILY